VTRHLQFVAGGRYEETDQVKRLNNFCAQHPGTEVTRPSKTSYGPERPWELKIPEPDEPDVYRLIVAWQLEQLMNKADKHYPAEQ
jgi:hypothetical protein